MTELDKFLEECETLAFDLETVNADEDTPLAFKKLVSIVKLQREALEEIKLYGIKNNGCCDYGCDAPSIAKECITKSNAVASEKGEL